MNKHLSQLVQLSKIDIEIDGYLPQIAAAKSKSDALNEKINALKIKNEKLALAIDEYKESKLKTDAHIATFAAKIDEIAKKQSSVKTEKEANALRLEEEIAREQLQAANEEIERFEKNIQAKKDEIKDNETQIASFENELAIAENEQKDLLDEIEARRNESYAKKDKLASELDLKVYAFYEKIRKWAQNTAVVPVRKQACFGCFMQLNSKTYNAVLKGDEINTCPHCGRIIYIEK